MGIRLSATVVDGIQTLFDCGAMGGWTDDRLVTQLCSGQESSEAALRVLIQRHGPMVMGICRRILDDEHAAEDAFQASFLVLLKKAKTLRDTHLLSNWLHGVAQRVATKEKVKAARRRVVEQRAADRSRAQSNDLEQSELRTVIDEEIRRLPERYRVPLILHYMEGLHLDAVASRLGCPMGTIQSRLSRARGQLQSRLARRGLAPTASALGAFLRPPGASALPLPLVEATVRTLAEVGLRGGVGKASGWSILKPVLGVAPSLHAGLLASGLLMCVGVGLLGRWVYQGMGGPPRPPATTVETHETIETKTTAAMPRSSDRPAEQARRIDSSPRAVSGTQGGGSGPPPASRSTSALASPLAGITIDGRLDDWPGNLRHYPIRNQIIGNVVYDSRRRAISHDPDGYFMAGYDEKAGLIYAAVVVKDDENVVLADASRTDDRVCLETDAVEIFVDGIHSEGKYEGPITFGDWRDDFDAADLPVLQYVGVPGPTPAYADPSGANPSLVHGRIKQTRTAMKYRREGDVTTYDWAVQAFDHYPDRPTRLHPGKKIGFEVAVLDKDRAGLPAYLTWGTPPTSFKGYDAGALGELILADRP